MPPAGWLSDRLLRRKKLTIVSASFQAAACLLVASRPTRTGAVAAPVLLDPGGYSTQFALASVPGVGSAALVQPIRTVR